MSHLKQNEKKLLGTVIIPLILVIAATIIVFMLGYPVAARAISILGTLGVMVFAMLFVVFFDSKKRWPNLDTSERFKKVITLQR